MKKGAGGVGSETTICPECGVRVNKKNLTRHLRRQHVSRGKTLGGPQPGFKSRRRDPVLADLSDGELAERVGKIKTQLRGLMPGFHADIRRTLLREKRKLARELQLRKASGVSKQWER